MRDLPKPGSPTTRMTCPSPLLSLLPPILQQIEFGITAAKRRERKRWGRFELASTTGDGLRSLLPDAFVLL